MNYVTTNIRLPEEDYLQLKMEAVRKRKSLAAIIRDKIIAKNNDKKIQGTKILLDLVEKAEKENWKGPADLAAKHDWYFLKAYSGSKNK